MGRFARSQDVAISTGQTQQPGVIVVPSFSSRRESKANKMKSQARRLYEMRGKGMKYLWIVLVTVVGLSAGWMLGQAWISPTQVPAQAAAIEPSEVSVASKQSSKENAIASVPSDKEAQSVEQDSQQNQASDYYNRRPNKARRNVAAARAPRARPQQGPVNMMLKPFKAINPLKLRKLRPW